MPYEDIPSILEGAIPGFTGLFDCSKSRDAVHRTLLTAITRTTLASTPEKTRLYLSEVDRATRALATGLLEDCLRAPDVERAVREKLNQLRGTCGNNHLAPSASTEKAVNQGIPEKNASQFQYQQLREQLAALERDGCLSPVVNFGIDPSHFPKTTKRLPRFVRNIVEGGKVTKRRGIKVMDVYDTTHGINVVSFFQRNRGAGKPRTTMPRWVGILREVIEIYAEFGVQVANVLADREFYSTFSYGAFSSGKMRPDAGGFVPVRLVGPTKFFSKNPKDGLTAVEKPDWDVESLTLWQKEVRSHRGLMEFLGDFIVQGRSGNVEVPVVHLAFHETPGSFQLLSESGVNATIQHILDHIANLEARLEATHATYQDLRRGTKLKERSLKTWKNKRKGDKQFKQESGQMYALWLEGQEILAATDRAREKLRKLKKKLRFYTVSVTQAEVEILRAGNERAKITLLRRLATACYEYHQRWGVENYFAMLKRDILHLSKTRGVNVLRQQWLQAQTVYNAYVLARTFRIARTKRKRGPRWKPHDPRRKTWRKPLSARDYRELSFNQFISEIAGRCLTARLRETFTRV